VTNPRNTGTPGSTYGKLVREGDEVADSRARLQIHPRNFGKAQNESTTKGLIRGSRLDPGQPQGMPIHNIIVGAAA
jgi:hypothetical protein